MNAVKIIDEIKHLPPDEQARVVRFVRALDKEGRLTGSELNELAGKLTGESDPARALALKEEIASGFYGKKRNA